MADAELLSDTFTITSIAAGKYDRVARLSASKHVGDPDLFITLDVNTELWPIAVGDRFTMTMASTIALDGSKDDGKMWRDVGKGLNTLADQFEYVCHGKIYRFEESSEDKIKVFASFGGLLLYIEGPYKRLTSLRIDYVYILLRKN